MPNTVEYYLSKGFVNRAIDEEMERDKKKHKPPQRNNADAKA